MHTVASPENFNTEIGLPLAVLAAPAGTEVLVLEMAMRGPGQIAELAAIAEPDVGVIVNIGPVHLELLGSLEAIAAAKAELIDGLAGGASVVVPAAESLLDPHLRADVRTLTFGDGGDVVLLERRSDGLVLIGHGGDEIELWPSFAQAHNLRNLLAAVAAARALGITPAGSVQRAFLLVARRASGASRRSGADRRLLQRQPDVHARRDRRPGRELPRRAAWRCSATCSSSVPRSGAFIASLASTRRAAGSTCS